MKILVLTNSCEGLASFRLEVLEGLLKNNEVFVSSPKDNKSVILETVGCKFFQTGLLNRHGTNPYREYKLIHYYCHLLTELTPDVVLTYTIKPNIYGGLAAKRAGIPYIPNVTGLGTALNDQSAFQHILSRMYLKSLLGAYRVFFQNEANAQFFYKLGLPRENTEILPGSGVNLGKHRLEPYPSENGPVIISVIGRIMKDKGTDEVLAAAKMLKPMYGDEVIFRLIGPFDGEYEDKVNAAVNAGDIEYIPNQTDIRPWMKESSAILHASYHEGMSNVLLEAAATGRPVIATDVPGCRETFIEGQTGIAFSARDADALATAVEKFLAIPYERRVAMGFAGRKFVEKHFDRRLVVDAYLKAIANL